MASARQLALSGATNAASARHAAAFAGPGSGIARGDAWSSTPTTSTTTSTEYQTSRAPEPCRRRDHDAEPVEQAGEHGDARERDDDRDPGPRPDALESDELQRAAQAALRRRAGARRA